MEKKAHGGDRKSSRQSDDLIEGTAQKLAEQYGVGARTIERDAKIAKVIDDMTELHPGVIFAVYGFCCHLRGFTLLCA